MGEIRENIRKNLGYYLTLKKMSQKELAEKLGVSQASVTCWIKGKNAPDIETVARICAVLDVSVTALFGTEGGAPSEQLDRAMLLFRELSPAFQACALGQLDALCRLQRETAPPDAVNNTP